MIAVAPRWCAILTAVLAMSAAAVQAQRPAPAPAAAGDTVAGSPRDINGRVRRGRPHGPVGLPGIKVTLHRVGPDHAGPLDSSVTTAGGSYHFRYRPFGSADAVYFVSATYDGITYFSSPIHATDAAGDDGAITVFDTTSAPFPIRLAGRHLVVSAPAADGRRQVAEVFELSNDSSLTAVSRDTASPVWSAHLPTAAVAPRVNPDVDIAPGAVGFRSGQVLVYAPISPGMRQLSYSYVLPRTAFPFTMPIEKPAGFLEVLLEEPKGVVRGAGLSEVAPAPIQGRTFRRFVAQDVPRGAVVAIELPTPSPRSFAYLAAISVTVGLAMLAALGVAFRRRAPIKASSSPALRTLVPTRAEPLLRDLAALDARFEGAANPSESEVTRYRAEREDLKSRLAVALAEDRRNA